MKRKSRSSISNPWYKRKPYLHFDFALKKPAAVEYILNKENIIKHGFSPLIHYTKIARKYKKNEKTGRFEFFKKKARNIFYASHIDGYIYAHYNYLLAEKYEDYLKKHGLGENISAYRLISKDGENYSNIQFAREVFEFVKKTKGCNVLCIDITGFFDNLCTNTLKNNWHRVWSNDGVGKLDEDHYCVFMSLKNFHYIEEKDIVRIFKDPRKKNKIDKNDQVARKNELNRSLHERICSFPELQVKIAASPLIRNKSELGITGIPQGTAISGMLANIAMIDFDLAIKKEVLAIGGFYRRYSDDIFVAFPNSIKFEDVEKCLEDTLRKYSEDCLKINGGKTDRGVYIENDNGLGTCYNDKGKLSPIQYLGFVFHGEKTHIRSSSMARNRSKIVQTIKKYKKGRSGQAKLGSINTRKVYKAQSPRIITPIDRHENKGFSYYAKRAHRLQNAPEISRQLKRNDRFIKNKIAEERKPKSS